MGREAFQCDVLQFEEMGPISLKCITVHKGGCFTYHTEYMKQLIYKPWKCHVDCFIPCNKSEKILSGFIIPGLKLDRIRLAGTCSITS